MNQIERSPQTKNGTIARSPQMPIAVDFQFADLHAGDFRVRSKALIERIGFRPWNWCLAGIGPNVKIPQ